MIEPLWKRVRVGDTVRLHDGTVAKIESIGGTTSRLAGMPSHPAICKTETGDIKRISLDTVREIIEMPTETDPTPAMIEAGARSLSATLLFEYSGLNAQGREEAAKEMAHNVYRAMMEARDK